MECSTLLGMKRSIFKRCSLRCFKETPVSCTLAESELTRSKRRKTSDVWMFFQDLGNGKATCNMCRKELSHKTSVTNLKTHIEKCHQNQHLIENRLERNLSTSTPVIQLRPQQSEHLSAERQAIIDNALARMIYQDFQPVNIVQDEGFKQLVQALNPDHVLPSRKILATSFLPAIYEDVKQDMKKRLCEATYVCISTDSWTSSTSEAFIGVSCHFVDNNFQLVSCILECKQFPEHHTSCNIAEKLNNIISDWNITGKIILCVTDNAANMKSAIHSMNLKHFGCFAHTLNLIVQCSIKEEVHVSSVINGLQELVTTIKRSHIMSVSAEVMYLERPLIPRQDDPLEWWKMNKDFFPNLQKVAKKYLCIMATSVPCERLFSKAGLLLADRRNRLSASKVNCITFLHTNGK